MAKFGGESKIDVEGFGVSGVVAFVYGRRGVILWSGRQVCVVLKVKAWSVERRFVVGGLFKVGEVGIDRLDGSMKLGEHRSRSVGDGLEGEYVCVVWGRFQSLGKLLEVALRRRVGT